MSQKISAKNLSYTQTLPPFLAALRGQIASSRSGGPDPLLASRRRHAKPRSGSAEAEDAPLVLDEEGNVVDGVTIGADGRAVRTEVEAEPEEEKLAEGKKHEDAEGASKTGGGNDAAVGIGARRKRKMGGKVIGRGGGGGSDEEDEEREAATKGPKEAQNGAGGGGDGPDEAAAKKPAGKESSAMGRLSGGKPKKKAKKIKLSFDHDDGD